MQITIVITSVITSVLGVFLISSCASMTSHEISRVGTSVPANCQNFSGWYELRGQAVEGYPNHYRTLKNPLMLDQLLGGFFSRDSKDMRLKVALVEIRQHKTMDLVVWSRAMVLDERPFGRADDHMSCEAGTIELLQEIDARGDGARNWLRFSRRMTLVDDDKLEVRVRIEGKGRLLPFFKYDLPAEEYQAVFKRVVGLSR